MKGGEKVEKVKLTYITHSGEEKTTIKEIYKNSYAETSLKLKREDPNVKYVIGVELEAETN